jgi:hypothetical protein
MTPIAPPAVHDTPPPAVEDAVIKEARRRARRRRVRQGIAVAAVAAAAMAALMVRDFQPPRGDDFPARAQDGDLVVPDISVPVTGPARLVASWGLVHVGWVLVYDDGRVLSYPDHDPVIERRLTPSGIAAVRAGSLELHSLRSAVTAPAGIWVDSEGHEYRPAAYAACLWAGANRAGEVRALPAAVRKVLRKAPPAQVDHAGTHSRRAASDVTSLWNCLRIDRAELAAIERAAVRVDRWMSGDEVVFARSTDGSRATVQLWPIMPHGRWIIWGG